MDFTYDINRLYELAKTFYTLTGIKTVIFDTDFNPIVSIPKNECAFCETLRQNPMFLKECKTCTKVQGKYCENINSLNIYKCHSGLFEATFPIKINGIIFGYFTIGQIIEENDKTEKKDYILDYASRFTDTDISPLFDKLNTKSYAQIEAAGKIMETCIAYLIMENIVRQNEGETVFRLNKYIEKNISDELSVEFLCEKFDLSRNGLYKLSRDFFGMPIAKFIRKKKMDTAAYLLEKGYSVSSAAESVGFYDYNYFSKVFKSVKGTAPRNFKKT